MGTEFRAQSGKVAIWTNESNDAPFTNPLGNLSRVKFHSDLDYIKIISTLSRTLSIPAIAATGSGGSDPGLRVASYSLGGHGQTGIPLCLAKIVVNGIPVAFTGSVPVHHTPPPSAGLYYEFYARWLAFGCDATTMWVHEYAMQDGDVDAQRWTSRPAQTFQITIYVTDVLL